MKEGSSWLRVIMADVARGVSPSIAAEHLTVSQSVVPFPF